MKGFLKLICLIGGLFALMKLAQVTINILYDNYGKNYITTEHSEEC